MSVLDFNCLNICSLNNIEAVFDASTKEISAGSNAFNITSGALTLDSSGDITIDADGGDVILKDGGTEYGRLSQVLGGLTLKSGASAANAKSTAPSPCPVDEKTVPIATAVSLDINAAAAAI